MVWGLYAWTQRTACSISWLCRTFTHLRLFKVSLVVFFALFLSFCVDPSITILAFQEWECPGKPRSRWTKMNQGKLRSCHLWLPMLLRWWWITSLPATLHCGSREDWRCGQRTRAERERYPDSDSVSTFWVQTKISGWNDMKWPLEVWLWPRSPNRLTCAKLSLQVPFFWLTMAKSPSRWSLTLAWVNFYARKNSLEPACRVIIWKVS